MGCGWNELLLFEFLEAVINLQRGSQPGSATWAGVVEELGTRYAPGIQHSAWHTVGDQ